MYINARHKKSRGIQIGPRIRIGGTVGKVGQNIKIGVGKVAKAAAPIAALVPGVGPLAAAGLAAGGTALDTSKGRVGLGNIVKAGALTGGLSKLGGLAKNIPGMSRLGEMVKQLPGAGMVGSAIDRVKGAGGAIDQAAGGAFTKLGHAAGDYFSKDGAGNGLDFSKILGAAGGAAALYGQHQANDQASKFLNDRLGMQHTMMDQATKDYASRAPMREAAFGKLAALSKNGPSGDIFRPYLNKNKAA